MGLLVQAVWSVIGQACMSIQTILSRKVGGFLTQLINGVSTQTLCTYGKAASSAKTTPAPNRSDKLAVTLHIPQSVVGVHQTLTMMCSVCGPRWLPKHNIH